MKKILLTIFGGLLCIGLQAQCMLYPVPLTERINGASVIVEGQVVNSYSFWDAGHTNIYTLHRVQAYKLFKGNLPARSFFILTEGGTVGLLRQQVTSTLELRAGEAGIFMGNPSAIVLDDNGYTTGRPVFEAIAGPQGFVAFDGNMQTARDAFKNYQINPELYNYIIDEVGYKPTIFEEYPQDNTPGTDAVPLITSFSPDTVSAGVKTVLTITGSGFGSTRGTGYVAFKDADYGGTKDAFPQDVEYISWTDTEIKIEVTGKAGTGTIRVKNSTDSVESVKKLVINFAQLNVVDGNGDVSQPVHIGKNGNGYTWQFYTGFAANTDAKQSFLRAFQNWRCGTLVNWDIGTNTSINTIARDNVQVIRFDIGTELPAGVLGRCTSWWSGCIQGPVTHWYVDELDIVFDDGANWNYGPGNPAFSEYDFESVAVHELGHGHQLGHVINPGEIMHYAIANGQMKRTLSPLGDLAGGKYVMTLNAAGSVCGKNMMTALNPSFCSLIPVANFRASATTVCPGVPVTFTDSSFGSTIVYNWDFGSGASPATAIGKGPHAVTYATAGQKDVRLIVEGVIDNDTATKTSFITVLAPKPVRPSAINGPDTACKSGREFWIDGVAGATAYTWGTSTGGTTNASADTVALIRFTSFGTANVWVKAGNSCGFSDSVVKSIVAFDNPAASFTYTRSNDTLYFNNTSVNASQYTWRIGAQTSNAFNILFVPTQSNTYNVELIADNTCGSDTEAMDINFIMTGLEDVYSAQGIKVYPNPFSNTATIHVGDISLYSTLTFELYDITGRKVQAFEVKDAQTTLYRNQLAGGMYIYKLTHNGEAIGAGRILLE